jgi:hypothetical protein
MKKWTAFIIGIILVVVFIITMFVLPPLLNWTAPTILSWQDFIDSISTVEGFVMGIITQGDHYSGDSDYLRYNRSNISYNFCDKINSG